MNILIDAHKAGFLVERFETREEWDQFAYEFRSNRGYYNPEPEDMHPPKKFPVTMISTPSSIKYHSNGNDTYWNMWLDTDCFETIVDPEQEDFA